MEFSEKLKELRSERGISQAKLAADIQMVDYLLSSERVSQSQH